MVGSETEPRWCPAAKIGETGVFPDARHLFKRRAGTKGGADQRAHAGARHCVNVNACVAKNAQNSDMCDAASEPASQRQANFWTAGYVVHTDTFSGQDALFFVQPLAQHARKDRFRHAVSSLGVNDVCVSSIDPCMLVL